MKTISTHAAAAKAIRQHLKERGIAGRVRSDAYSGGDSVNVSLHDQPPAVVDDVRAFAGAYQYGQFDGMTDCYNYTNRREDLPQVSFVSVDACYSAELRQAAWDELRRYIDEAAELPADYTKLTSERVWGDYATSLVFRFLRGSRLQECYARFWLGRGVQQEACAA